MLRLFEGGFSSPLQAELVSAISDSIAGAKRVFLIVPEQETVMRECEMSELLPPSAPLSFEVTNFTRFTNTLFREIGGISGEYCSGAARALIMWRTLSELSDVLALTRTRRVISEGVVSKALAAVSEMQARGITPDELATVNVVGDSRLAEKLSDLSLIFSLYMSHLTERYGGEAADAGVLADMLQRKQDALPNTEIFVDGFTSFTEPQYKLLGVLISRLCLNVTLVRNIRGGGFEFSEIEKTRERLLRLADGAGERKELKRVGAREMSRAGIIGEIAELLWRNDGEIDNDSLHSISECGGRVRIFSAPTVYEECDFVAQDIKRRVILGERYKDFAVVVRRTSPYLGILDVALNSAGIPTFLSRSEDLSATSLVKLVSTAYRIVLYGYRKEDVLTYLKSGLLDISPDESDRFEIYVEKWNIDGRRFTDELAWNMNPAGYSVNQPIDEELLLLIDSVRWRIISPLMRFEAGVKSAKTVHEQAEVLLSHLTSLNMEEVLLRSSGVRRTLGLSELADEAGAMWGVMCGALDLLVEVLGDCAVTPDEFASQLTVALSAIPVGSLPSVRDSVTVGAADMLRIKNKKHIYLIGVNEGEFPGTVSEGSYFGEREKILLSNLGLSIEPELEISSAREFYSFSRAFAAAEETVTLLYAERSPLMRELSAAEPIARIKNLTRGTVTPIPVGSLSPSLSIYSADMALESLGSLSEKDRESVTDALLRAGFGEAVKVAEGDIQNAALSLSEHTLAMLYEGDLYLSQTKIDKFIGCPMSYFLKYNLRLDEDRPAELSSGVMGSFVHAVIENFFFELERQKIRAADVSDEDRENITRRCAERYTEELFGFSPTSARTRVAVSRLVRATKPIIDGLCEELSGSEYEPKFFELETSMHDPASPDHIVFRDSAGGKVIIRGTIDRVDTLKRGEDVYVRVIDYKTGYNDFLPSKLRRGEYLQMFLYLKAIKDSKKPGFLERLGVGEGGKVIPAGVIYVKTRIADTTVRSADDELAKEAVKGAQARDGMLLSDPESLDAMNPDYMPPKPGKYSRSFEPREYDMSGWAEIESILRDVTVGVADGMRCGNVKATPASGDGRNCKWCPYKGVCRTAVIKNDF